MAPGDMNVGFGVSDPRQGAEARNTREELIHAISVCIEHTGETTAKELAYYLAGPPHDSRMTARNGRIITNRKAAS